MIDLNDRVQEITNRYLNTRNVRSNLQVFARELQDEIRAAMRRDECTPMSVFLRVLGPTSLDIWIGPLDSLDRPNWTYKKYGIVREDP